VTSTPTRRAAVFSVFWLALGLAVGAVLLPLEGSTMAVEYTTVYLIERSLSLDNVFVFLLLFGTFRVVDESARRRVLIWGIVGALVVRGVAILLGTELIDRFHWVLYLLGLTLLWVAWQMLRGGHEDEDPSDNAVVRGVRRLVPVTDDHHAHHFFVRRPSGRFATPLAICLVAVIVADITFAVDSIPAAFGITRDPFVIWLANFTALLGLISLFVLVDELVKRFRYMSQTLALVLAFIGVELLMSDVVHVGPGVSLAVVLGILTTGVVASLLADRRDHVSAEEREHRHAPRPPVESPEHERAADEARV
jgi:tellurite resistance protein TerC